MIFWNIKYKTFFITDINGNELYKGVILYSPFITYHELKQLYKYYKLKYYELTKGMYQLQGDPYPDKTETKMCEKSNPSKTYGNEEIKMKTLKFGAECEDM